MQLISAVLLSSTEKLFQFVPIIYTFNGRLALAQPDLSTQNVFLFIRLGVHGFLMLRYRCEILTYIVDRRALDYQRTSHMSCENCHVV